MNLKHQPLILSSLLGLSLIACGTNLETNTLEEANPINLETSDPVETEISLAATAAWIGEKPIFNDATVIETGRSITTDNQGNVIASAYDGADCCNYDATTSRLFLAKLNSSGNKLWQISRTYPATFRSSYQITADGNRNIYVVGGTTASIDGQRSNGLQDAFITKFSPNGTVIWSRLIGAIGDDGATGVGVDSSNNVYVGGYACGQNRNLGGKTIRGACDMFVTKFNAAGARQWLQLVGTDGLEIASEIAVNANGDVAIGGATTGAFAGQTRTGTQDAFAAKLNSSGTLLWVNQFAGVTNPVGAASASISQVGIDALGTVIVAGYTSGTLDGLSSATSSYGTATAFIRRLRANTGGSVWTVAVRPANLYYNQPPYSFEVAPIFKGLQVNPANGYVYAETYSAGGYDPYQVNYAPGLVGYAETGTKLLLPARLDDRIIDDITLRGNDLYQLKIANASRYPTPQVFDVNVAKLSLTGP
jgi:Beta-propeller repeat